MGRGGEGREWRGGGGGEGRGGEGEKMEGLAPLSEHAAVTLKAIVGLKIAHIP